MNDAKTIKDATRKPSVFFPSMWDEEVTMLRRLLYRYHVFDRLLSIASHRL